MINIEKFVQRLEEIKKWDKNIPNLDFIKNQIISLEVYPYVYFIEENFYSLEWDNIEGFDYIEISLDFNSKNYHFFYSVNLVSKNKTFSFEKNIKNIIKEEL